MTSAAAPGKILFTGAYAVLEGAPAVVMAVNRYAYAQHASHELSDIRPEVRAVASLLNSEPPRMDVSELEHHGKKLGLGSSAAAAVAATGILSPYFQSIFSEMSGIQNRTNETGIVVPDPSALDSIFQIAYQAHSQVQPRGSGVDVAASTYGKTLCARRIGSELSVKPIQIPQAIVWQAFAVHRPTRTSDVLDRLNSLRSQQDVDKAMSVIHDAAFLGESACIQNDAQRFLEAARQHVSGLSNLGKALGLELIPQELTCVQTMINSNEIVLLPSGAGGGDLVLWLSTRAPSEHEILRSKQEGLNWIPLAESRVGLHWRHE